MSHYQVKHDGTMENFLTDTIKIKIQLNWTEIEIVALPKLRTVYVYMGHD